MLLIIIINTARPLLSADLDYSRFLRTKFSTLKYRGYDNRGLTVFVFYCVTPGIEMLRVQMFNSQLLYEHSIIRIYVLHIYPCVQNTGVAVTWYAVIYVYKYNNFCK